MKTSTISITGGELRGRKLTFPAELCHPMGSRERLALFNILSPIAGLKVLDLFAGSGALGFEAFSREAYEVVFIESNPKLADSIRDNLVRLNLNEKSKICRQNVQTFLAQNPAEKFDVIFADPPYDDLQPEFLERISAFLAPGGRFVLSNPATPPDPRTCNPVGPKVPGLHFDFSRAYAGCQLNFYHK